MAFPSTFLDLQTSVITKARLDTTLDTAKVKDWINQVYFQVCVETEASITTTTINCVAGTSKYTLAATIARIKQMAVKPSGSTQFNPPLILTTLDEILNRRQAGGDAQTSGAWATHYTLLGINDLELWPTPAAADVVTVYYAAFPTALSANGDLPILEEPYASKLLEYGALAQAGDFKGDPATADWENGFALWMAKYEEHLRVKRGVIPGQFHQWSDRWDSSAGGSVFGGY